MPARRFASLVKIEHTVFALPYAYVGAILAVSGWPGLHGMLWITVAMAGARSFAMAANRLIDAAIDARNPRTASARAPRGAAQPDAGDRVRGRLAAGLPDRRLAARSDHALAVAVRDRADGDLPLPEARHAALPPLAGAGRRARADRGLGRRSRATCRSAAWLLGAAVALWIAGFDVIYATFDLEIDRAQGLHSLPVDFGLARALTTVRVAAPGDGRAAPGGRPEPVARARLLRGSRDRRRCLLAYENSHRAPGRPLAGRRGLLLGERGDRRPVSGCGRDRRRALGAAVAAPVVELLRHRARLRRAAGAARRRAADRAGRLARAVRRQRRRQDDPAAHRGGAAPPVAGRGAHRGRVRAHGRARRCAGASASSRTARSSGAA